MFLNASNVEEKEADMIIETIYHSKNNYGLLARISNPYLP